MNYIQEYYSIIKNRKTNIILESEIGENHHITPKSFFMCGECDNIINHSDNLVRLTCEEHFMAHYYLYKHYETNFIHTTFYHKSLEGFKAMGLKTNDSNRFMNAKLYEEGKRALREYYKEENIKFIKEICMFINKHTKIPSRINENERFLSRKLETIKIYKNTSLFYEEYNEVALLYNLPWLFYDSIEKEIYDIQLICNYYMKNNKPPSRKSTDVEIKRLGKKLSRLKSSYKKEIINDNYLNEFNKLNCMELLYSKEKSELLDIRKISKFIEKYNRTPKYKYEKEKQLYHKLHSLKRKYKLDKLSKESINIFKKYNIDYLL